MASGLGGCCCPPTPRTCYCYRSCVVTPTGTTASCAKTVVTGALASTAHGVKAPEIVTVDEQAKPVIPDPVKK